MLLRLLGTHTALLQYAIVGPRVTLLSKLELPSSHSALLQLCTIRHSKPLSASCCHTVAA